MKLNKFFYSFLIVLIIMSSFNNICFAKKENQIENKVSSESKNQTDEEEESSEESSNDNEEKNERLEISKDEDNEKDGELEINSEAAILIERSTGNILFAKNVVEKMFPASTTKILTAIIALEECELDEVATVSKNAVDLVPAGYTNAKLMPGEEMTVEDLLYALMLNSANEAANVLAEHISGSIENFAELMNEKAEELKCHKTHFVNANGMHDDDHYTTALDLAIISNYAMKNKEFQKIVATPKYTLPNTDKYDGELRVMRNTNKLIQEDSKYYMEEATGIKTGYTKQAGNCLVASAKKDGIELIAVTLKADSAGSGNSSKFIDDKNLLNYGFDNFTFQKIFDENETVDKVKIDNAKRNENELELVVKDEVNEYVKNDTNVIKKEVNINDNLEAPIKKGDVVGNLVYQVNGKNNKLELVAKNDVQEKSDFLNILLIVLGFIILILAIIILNKRNRRKRKKIKYTKYNGYTGNYNK